MHSNYFTVLGYDKNSGSYTHFTDCSSFSKAELYAKYLTKTSQARAFGGELDLFEIWDINKNRLSVVSPESGREDSVVMA